MFHGQALHLEVIVFGKLSDPLSLLCYNDTYCICWNSFSEDQMSPFFCSIVDLGWLSVIKENLLQYLFRK